MDYSNAGFENLGQIREAAIGEKVISNIFGVNELDADSESE